MVRTLIVLAVLWPAAAAQAQVLGEPVGEGPKPAARTIAWEFDFRYVDLRRIDVHVGNRTQAYWYMLYTVSNPSSQTQRFYPQFEILTDSLDVLPSDVGIPAAVYEAIRERHRLTHKYLVHPTKAIGPLRSGSDNAIESMAVWPATAVQSNDFTVYVAGLSGEARLVPNPAYDPDQPEAKRVPGPLGRPQAVVVNPKAFTLRKTLAISYKLAGSAATRGFAQPMPVRVTWIMR